MRVVLLRQYAKADAAFWDSIRGPLNQIPSFSIRILQLNVSISRMEAFFAEPEISQHAAPGQRAAAPRLAMHGATMRYAGTDSGEPALQDLTLVPPEGKLTVVSGPTGCGKTSRASLCIPARAPG